MSTTAQTTSEAQHNIQEELMSEDVPSSTEHNQQDKFDGSQLAAGCKDNTLIGSKKVLFWNSTTHDGKSNVFYTSGHEKRISQV
ncbi:hypothetical protein DAPPUDRAFT_245879 [Daphnia pulex]|uniref:Uncharacterized protein n=1 Tax=Daphnia pulex TaxID=6669 RepID=E9GP78_DAPPU|nr:hypothetical protein DAPPUDRAFT_245879 [Daphnia pulex]|eukprot:EFX78590.1 hypothetical protein DAPPUDRAFT_245879 [Daphnia pulex]